MAGRRLGKGGPRYGEGFWVGLPLDDGEWGVGVIARGRRGRALYGYFFAPVTQGGVEPVLEDVLGLTREDALYACRFSDLGIKDGSWRVLGEDPGWDREAWPMPPLVMEDEFIQVSWLRHYDQDDPSKFLGQEKVPKRASTYLNRDGLAGCVFVQQRLSSLSGHKVEKQGGE